VGIGLVACHPQAAQPPPGPPPPPPLKLSPDAEKALAGLYAESQAPGMVAAVVQGDAAAVRGFGRMAPNDPRVPDGATLVRLDSISKLFASELLARLVVAHRLALTDPLIRFAPPGWKPPAPTGKDPPPITLVQLATHTSGLPRAYPFAVPPAPPPTAAEAMAARWAWLGQRRDARDAGQGARYSNLGFEFLGDADAAGAHAPSYVDALRDWVTGPLGMADTAAAPSPAACARTMAGDPGWNAPPCSDQSFHAASGGLYSTADDMARWMASELAAGPPDPARRISQAIYVRRDQLAYASGVDVAGPANGIGLAWIELAADPAHPRLIEKTGGGYGFMTYVVLDPARRIGVFFAINRVSGGGLKRLAGDANDLVAALGGFRPSPRGSSGPSPPSPRSPGQRSGLISATHFQPGLPVGRLIQRGRNGGLQ
jgi:D-alanyl-D-alanine-carboxypeptidase/D-alanyl-D-alanine-endopeptidase